MMYDAGMPIGSQSATTRPAPFIPPTFTSRLVVNQVTVQALAIASTIGPAETLNFLLPLHARTALVQSRRLSG